MAARARTQAGRIRYEFTPGSRLGSKRLAQRVGEELAKLAGPNLTIAPEDVLTAAADDDSLLHQFFQWDDRQAAHKYRLHQARQVLRSIMIVHISGSQVHKERNWLSLKLDGEDGVNKMRYVKSEYVWSQPSLADRVLEQARSEAAAFVSRYERYEHLAKAVRVGKAMVAVLEKEKRRA